MRITKKMHPHLFCALDGCNHKLTVEQQSRCARYEAGLSPQECARYCSRAHKELAAQRRRRARRAELKVVQA